MVEIKLCPHCGGMAGIFIGEHGASIACRSCGVQTNSFRDFSWSEFSKRPAINTLIELWNQRSEPDVFNPYKYEGTYYCGNCNDPINKGDKFCHECGMAVKWE